jgi:carboxypeptidase Q
MTRITSAAFVLVAVTVAAQSPSDRDLLTKIRTEGTEHSQAQRVFDTLTVDIGPRLTASPAHKRAVEFVRAELASYGLDNVHVEPWKFGRGWTLDQLVVEMTEPRYLPLIGYADGWSAATEGELAAAPLFIGGKTPDEVEAMRARLKGAIVMT